MNTNAGPDFFNAKVKIGNTIWAGDVEIHRQSEEWSRHHHDKDKAYNSVILHVVENITEEVFNEKGQSIPQIKIDIPESVSRCVEYLMKNPAKIPCQTEIKQVPKHIISTWIDSLGIERLERKTRDIFKNLKRYNNSWNDVFYLLLSRNYGFGLNSDTFERLALSLPYNIIQKHRDDLFEIEALLFGQAGMLEKDEPLDEYYIKMRNEYLFLQKKYLLKPLDSYLFKLLRVRPQSFPQIRIAQLASLLQHSTGLFSTVLEIKNYKLLRLFFQVNVSEYWQTHYVFGKSSVRQSKYPGEASLNTILINSAAPLLFAYGKKMDMPDYCERAFSILESLEPERNSIISDFKRAGLEPRNAFDTQAIIQLRKEYCDKRKCLYCKIGYSLLSRRS